MPGFKAYSLLEVSPDEIMSVSAWGAHAEAEEAIAAALTDGVRGFLS